MGKRIEAEGNELVLRNEHGDIIIIPKNKRQRALNFLKAGNHKGIDNIASKLPKMASKAQKGDKVPFEEWYKTVPKDKNDTLSYNLRRAYELAPKEELDAFVNNPEAHLRSVYRDPKTNIYEFVKSKHHPTIKLELDWFHSNDPEAVQFRNEYYLDDSGEYYRYMPKAAPRTFSTPTRESVKKKLSKGL